MASLESGRTLKARPFESLTHNPAFNRIDNLFNPMNKFPQKCWMCHAGANKKSFYPDSHRHVTARHANPPPIIPPHVLPRAAHSSVLPTAPLMAPDVATTNGASTAKPSQKLPTGPNVLEVVLGSLLIKPWYPSFYPEELVGRRVERLYVCQWCFRYSKELAGFLGHLVSLWSNVAV